MPLETYRKKRDFKRTTEPKGTVPKRGGNRFVVQEHHARQLHYDFRLEMAGVLKSWAVPKGPSLNPIDKRLAVMVEDHPVEYIDFEGHIAEGNYGAGAVVVWDGGAYKPLSEQDPEESIEKGKFTFVLNGKKLKGEFALVRMGQQKKNWLLIKARDEFADPKWKTVPILHEESAVEKKTRKRVMTESESEGQSGRSAASLLKPSDLKGKSQVEIESNVLTLTNLDKVYWPDEDYRKADLIQYYFEISKTILPYLKSRPLILKRYPNGIAGKPFIQHNVEDAPEFLRTEEIKAADRMVRYALCENVASLVYLANLGTIEFHAWNSRSDSLDHPDWFVIDLDPGTVSFDTVCELALSARDILQRLGLESYAKTSGGKGMHIYVPLKPVHPYPRVGEFAIAVAMRVVAENQEVATTERMLKKRKSTHIYVDAMQNGRGKAVVAPYSVRGRSGATVSAPLDWDEVRHKPSPEDFTIKNMMERVSRKKDLFKSVLTDRQSLDGAEKKLERL